MIVFLFLTVGCQTGMANNQGSKAGEIHVKRLILDDEQGRPRAVLGITKIGPFMKLLDEAGKSSIVMIVSKEGTGLALYDVAGNQRVSIGATTLITVKGPKKGTQTTTPSSSIVLFGDDGKVIWQKP